MKTRALAALVICAATPFWSCTGAKGETRTETVVPMAATGDLSIFDACNRQPALGLGVYYMCETMGFGAFISERLPWDGPSQRENLLKFAKASAQSIHGPGLEASAEAGKAALFTDEVETVWYSADGAEDVMDFRGRYALAPAGEQVRVIACFTSTNWGFEGCEDILTLLYPERVYEALKSRYKVSPPRFAGAAMRIPEGCQKTGSRTITCPHSEIAVAPVPSRSRAQASEEIAADQRLFFEELCGQPQVWSSRCTLAGVESVCHHARCVSQDGALQALVALSGADAASCRFDPQKFSALPPVCAQIVSSSIEEPAEP